MVSCHLKLYFVNLRLDIVPLEIAEGFDLDLAVEMTNVTHDCAIFHVAHMVNSNYVCVSVVVTRCLQLKRPRPLSHD